MKLQKIHDIIVTVETLTKLFGAKKEFSKEYYKRCDQIGRAICKELGITKSEAMSLKPDTELKSEAVKTAVDSLCQWLSTQHDEFKRLVA